MKRFFFALLCLFIYISNVQAQNDTVLNVSQLIGGPPLEVCKNKYDRVVLYAVENCEDFFWYISGVTHNENPLILDQSNNYVVNYIGCGINTSIIVRWHNPNVPTETTEEIWIHGGELAELKAVEDDSASMYDIKWNTGEEENVIYKPAGTYIAGISDMCATAYRTKIVRETPELTASCDLATGYNMLEWETNTEQATYVVSLNIYYDYDPNCLYSELVANVDYNAGSYIDTGHDSWQSPCQYHAVPVMANGEEAPLRTYWVRTISLFDLMGTQGLQQLQWTPYVTEKDEAKNTSSVLAYKIFDVVDGQPSYRATVGSFATSYNYDPSQFNGHAAVAAQFNNGAKDELLAYSRTQYKIGDPDGTQENKKPTFAVYPNPTTGVINIQVEGNDHNITIYNMVGQTIYTGVTVNGVFTTPRLIPGLYTVVCDGNKQKVVVE